MCATTKSNKAPRTSSAKNSALEIKLEEQSQIIASVQTEAALPPVPLTPAPPTQQPLQPPTGVAQRGQQRN